jgi:hypothetical protein
MTRFRRFLDATSLEIQHVLGPSFVVRTVLVIQCLQHRQISNDDTYLGASRYDGALGNHALAMILMEFSMAREGGIPMGELKTSTNSWMRGSF